MSMNLGVFLANHHLSLTASICLIAVTIPTYKLINEERANVGAVQRSIADQGKLARDFLKQEIEGSILPRLDKSGDRVDAHVSTIQNHLLRVVDQLPKESEAYRGTLLMGIGHLSAQLEGVRNDLKPSLQALNHSADSLSKTAESVTSLSDDFHESWDDNYDDLKATVQSSTVAVAGIGRAADEAAKAAPKIRESVESVAGSVDGIAKDAKREADEFVKPKSIKQQIFDYLKMGALIAHYLF